MSEKVDSSDWTCILPIGRHDASHSILKKYFQELDNMGYSSPRPVYLHVDPTFKYCQPMESEIREVSVQTVCMKVCLFSFKIQ